MAKLGGYMFGVWEGQAAHDQQSTTKVLSNFIVCGSEWYLVF